MHFTHPKAPKQIANRVIAGEARPTQQRRQRTIAAQPVGMHEAPGSYQHGHQEGDPCRCRIDPIMRSPADRPMGSNLTHQIDPPKKLQKDHHPAEWRDGSLRLAHNQPLFR